MAAPIALRVRVNVRVEAVAAGGGVSTLGGLNADDPAYGPNLYPGQAPIAQTIYFQDSEQVPGTAGSWTLANINTALTAAVATIAGTTAPTVIDATTLAQINAWSTGSP